MGVCVNANTAVIPANVGTHTPCPVVWGHCPRPSVQRTPVVMFPAFAGTTKEDSIVKPPEPSLRGAQRRSNPTFFLLRDGLLRFARNDVDSISDTTSSSRREAP